MSKKTEKEIEVILAKVSMLNDWHHTVDRRLDVIDERLRWVLRLVGAALLLGAGERGVAVIKVLLGG